MKQFLDSCHGVNIFLEWDHVHTEAAGNTLASITNILTESGFNEVESYHNDKLFYKE